MPVAVERVSRSSRSTSATWRRCATAQRLLPASLPALLWADKVTDRLDRAGTPVPEPPPEDDDLGERLLALVLQARRDGVDAEQALRAAVRRRLGR